MAPAATLKAEMVLALQLAIRHRAVRLTGLLAVIGVVLARTGGGAPSVLVLVAGVVGATAASRALAPGAACHMARRAGAHPLVVAGGRLAGIGLVLAAGLALAAAAGGGVPGPVRLGWASASLVGGMALAAPVLALTPAIGASGAAGLGILAAVFGQISPAALAGFLAPWPIARDAGVLVWNAAPLGWRVDRWVTAGTAGDGLLLAGWVALGVLATAWTLLPPRGPDGSAQ